MAEDARFRDGDPSGPLRLWATDAADLQVISALCQDAVLSSDQMRWDRDGRRFALLLNRFRWEDRRNKDRVRAVLEVGDVARVQSQGIAPDPDTVLSLLALEWAPGADGAGMLTATFAGDGALRIDAECLDLRLTDVTRAYAAPSGRRPEHPT